MNKIGKLLFAAGCVVALGGCAGTAVQQAENTAPGGSEFSQNLYAGYLGLAQTEYSENDYSDADYFANKAIASSGGGTVGPQEIGERDIAANRIGALTGARGRLTTALAAGAAEKAPADAAKAQTSFDCWLQEQEEDLQPDHINACIADFIPAMAAAEAAVKPAPKVAVATPAPQPVKAEDKNFIIYFGYNEAEPKNLERIKIVEAAAYAVKNNATIYVTGHTDTSGSNDYNAKLAAKRAANVTSELFANGVAENAVAENSSGEDSPAVDSGDGAKEARNRRVEISVRPN